MRHSLEVPRQSQIEQIASIWFSGWHEGHAEIVPARLRKLRSQKSFSDRTQENLSVTRIASDGDDVLGFCMVRGDELYQMYVSPRARGSGVAQALMQDAENRIRAGGHKTAWLACAIGNERAGRFYEKSGWSNSGREVVDLDTSEGAFPLEVWRFEKRLSNGDFG